MSSISFVLRSNNVVPTMASSCLIWCDSVGWVTCRRAAARVKLRSTDNGKKVTKMT